MIIKINDVAVSVPSEIEEWVVKNDDNYTEFEDFIQTLVYAAKQKKHDKEEVDSSYKNLAKLVSDLLG